MIESALTAERIRRALGLRESAELSLEPTGLAPNRPVMVRVPGDARRTLLVRPYLATDDAATNLQVLADLAAAGFAHAPLPVASIEAYAIEAFEEGLTPLQFAPDQAQWEAAIDALASLHERSAGSGRRWGEAREELLPRSLPLFRLGFTREEREAAEPLLAEAAALLAATPFGFVHGRLLADTVTFGPSGPTFHDFAQAGFGAQLVDVVSLLATAGLPAAERARLASRYGERRSLAGVAELADLATLIWGLHELIELPRRQVEVFGDDVATEELVRMARNIERALRETAAEHPLAARIRAALWGGSRHER